MSAAAGERVLGVIADSHGFVCPQALRALEGVEAILHAGDIGSEDVLERLRALAPVVAVVGNGDPELTHRYPWEQHVEIGDFRILLCHWYDNHGTLHPRVARELSRWRPHVLVYGHTHRARAERSGDTLLFNPGYAGAPEPARERSVGRLHLAPDGGVRGEIVPLGDA